ncbi:MAG: aminotransferase class V-fold PLP-dependent enzyme [Alphaproteobacteria bacterium]|nr:aminotransferase class V-fold PLP-dependent enzyme [Alphaproteobacteria bacterium]
MNKIIYLDSAATALKPETVIRTEADFMTNHYANSGRGVCARAAAVDDMVARTRARVADFINANPNQVVFTAGATDGLNRIVNIISRQPWYAQMSTFAVSDLDHHSARLPWEELLHRGMIRKMFVCELNENFDIKIDSVPKVDFLVITAMSNVLGRAQDVEKIISTARRKNPNVVTVVDASQYVVHEKIDVKKWDTDFLVFSGHKIGADTGVGILYIRDSEKYFPDKFGGGMVLSVGDIDVAKNASNGACTYENDTRSCWVAASAPEKWEAGTLPLAQIAGLAPAIDYLESNRPNRGLIKYAYDELSVMPCVKILTTSDAAILSFNIDGMHPLDVGVMLGARNICVRVGNMCASWIHRAMGVAGSVRMSVGASNTVADVAEFVAAIRDIVK